VTTTTADCPFTPGELAGLRSACAAVVAAPGDDRYDDEVATWNLDVKQGWDLDNMFRVGHALLPPPG
jgi:hypothetical protein